MFKHRNCRNIPLRPLSLSPPLPHHKGFYYEKAIKFHRWAADYVQALIEGTYGRKMKLWGGIVDSLINNLAFETSNIHLRQGEGSERGRRGEMQEGKEKD